MCTTVAWTHSKHLSIVFQYLYILYTYYQIEKKPFLLPHYPTHNLYTMLQRSENTIRETIAKSDLSISICSLKSTLKKHILSLQKFGTFYEWDNQKTLIFS